MGRQAQKKRKSSSENTETFFNYSKNSSQAIPPNDVIVIDADSDENMSENNEVISDDDIKECKPQSSTQNENINCPSASTAELENTEKIKIKDANAVPSTSTAESNNLK